MINGKRILALIPARGGSKGIQRKNLVELGGKPLIAWTIIEAKKCAYIDKVIVSTDDKEIAEVSSSYGADIPFIRPRQYANDSSTSVEVTLHAISELPLYDTIILLQPTSPLRTSKDIDATMDLYLNKDAKSCISVVMVDKHPYWTYYLDNKSKQLSPVVKTSNKSTNRQEMTPAFAPNGAIYISNKQWFNNKKTFITDETLAYIMPKERSIDIDSDLDLKLCQQLIK